MPELMSSPSSIETKIPCGIGLPSLSLTTSSKFTNSSRVEGSHSMNSGELLSIVSMDRGVSASCTKPIAEILSSVSTFTVGIPAYCELSPLRTTGSPLCSVKAPSASSQSPCCPPESVHLILRSYGPTSAFRGASIVCKKRAFPPLPKSSEEEIHASSQKSVPERA